jgi:hypothetical protein
MEGLNVDLVKFGPGKRFAKMGIILAKNVKRNNYELSLTKSDNPEITSNVSFIINKESNNILLSKEDVENLISDLIFLYRDL